MLKHGIDTYAMKNLLIPALILSVLTISSCKKDKKEANEPQISSAEHIDGLLFVNKNNYQILTDENAVFSSTDPDIEITSDGTIQRLTSGETAEIEIEWVDKGVTTRIYALGATDNNHVNPFEKYHAAESTDPYNQYIQGWKTLQKLPVSSETYVIVLRHADADNGKDFSKTTGPPNWWKSCDPADARQLNEQGIERAAELGKVFKDLKFPIQRVVASEFCRAVKTAELINAGPEIEIDSRLNHPAYSVSGKGLFDGLKEMFQELVVDNKMTLISTHHPINEFEKSSPVPTFPGVSAFNWTGAYLVKVNPDKTYTYEGAVSYGMFKHWRDKKLNRL